MHLVTGGAGFIGSNIVAALSERGSRVVVCDRFGQDHKWQNLQRHALWDIVFPEGLAEWLARNGSRLDSVIHMGAISATTERDVDLIVASNLHLSQFLWDFCTQQGVPFIYASSAATYGDGSEGFVDDFTQDALSRLLPLNPYGWSKHLFDRKVRDILDRAEEAPPKWAGLKFFNVYGPNEYHKGSMRSVIATHYEKIASGEPLRLFKSDHPDYEHGGQMRDFVYVQDCVDVVLWMLERKFPSDVYNLGTGQARSWLDLGRAMFKAVKLAENIEYIDMPDHLKGKYQYFTQAEISKLRAAGFTAPFTSLEDGVGTYVADFLASETPHR